MGMNGKVEWANYGYLANTDYANLSKDLLWIEANYGRRTDFGVCADSRHPSRRFEYPWVYFNLQLSQDDVILEAGAGYTLFRFLVAQQVKEVYSIDTDRESVAWSKARCDGFSNVIPTLGDVTSIPFSSNYFGKTYCISVLEHLPKDKVVSGIEELIRVTKPNGQIAITMDVSLETTIKQIDFTDFTNLAKRYSLVVPELPPNAITFRVGEIKFAIACISLKGQY